MTILDILRNSNHDICESEMTVRDWQLTVLTILENEETRCSFAWEGASFFGPSFFLKCCFQKLGEAPAQLPFPVKQHSPSPLLPTGARWMTMKENEGECRTLKGIEGEWRRALNDNVGQRNPVEDQRKSPILCSDRCDPPAFSNSTAEKFLRQIISVCLTCFLLWLTLENTFSYIWPASHLLMRTR